MALWVLAAALNGLMAVAVGALAAHGLQAIADGARLGWVDTAVRYQMLHAAALLGVAALAAGRGTVFLTIAGAAFLAGTVLFCGSLYLLAWLGWRGLVWITPLGGLAFLLGWAALAAHGIRRWRSGAG